MQFLIAKPDYSR